MERSSTDGVAAWFQEDSIIIPSGPMREAPGSRSPSETNQSARHLPIRKQVPLPIACVTTDCDILAAH
ncbi:MAG: hypothetical protein ACREKM_09910, partial [Longimicrobiales bacterium]